MASVEKFKSTAVSNILRHDAREIRNPANKDIDPVRRPLNYRLTPDHEGLSDYGYYQQRLSEVYHMNRADVVTMAGWVVTLPKDTPQDQEERFFLATERFLENRYGVRNVIQSTVHRDEQGQPHLHFNWIPVAKDTKASHNTSGIFEKVSAKEVLCREDLRSFHRDLQEYLQVNHITGTVYSGITARNGGNRTVAELKDESRANRWEHYMETKERVWGE